MIFIKGFFIRKLVKTSSPSIDILISSNFERFLYSLKKNEIFKENFSVKKFYEKLRKDKKFFLGEELHGLVRESIKSGFCEEEFVEGVIRDTFEEYKVVIDPHTAVGLKVAQDYLKKNEEEKKKNLKEKKKKFKKKKKKFKK